MRESREKYLEKLTAQRHRAQTLVWPETTGKPAYGALRTTPVVSFKELVKKLKVVLVPIGGRNPFFGGPKLDYPAFAWLPAVRPKKVTLRQTSLFTLTLKMRAPSWGLPSGPPRLGGTCPAAAERSSAGFVCHNCYATSDNYSYPNNQLYAAVRMHWTQQQVRAGTFAASIVEQLQDFNSKQRYDRNHKPVSASYFRIHDTGDIDWLPGYLEAWVEIARQLPRIMFWMPTRAWSTAKGLQMLGAARRRPRNLIIRPSGLYVDGPVPEVAGLNAGTTVCFNDPEGNWTVGGANHDCPAVINHDDCETENCRRCWNEPDTVVNYRPHGGLSVKVRKFMAGRAKNPKLDLEDMWASYERAAGSGGRQANPMPPDFPSHIKRSGRNLSDWTYEEWEDFLLAHGLEDDDVGQWLAETAEYD